jgi:4-amino-4-deoxy-L-arabinose transferase-like glycosyltransferase
MRRDLILILLIGGGLFFPFLGAVHLFDWDEINFAECSREMLLTGDWFRPQIDYAPFWEKPPLFLWFQALSMEVFGIGEFGARFPNAVCGVVTLLVVYQIGCRLHDRMFGWMWAMAWMGSLLPHLYFRSGIIDPWFNLLIFLSLYGFIEFRWQFFSLSVGKSWWWRYRQLYLGGFTLGLAVMTKGPAAYLLVFLTLFVYWAIYRFKGKGYGTHLLYFGLTSLIAPLLWFGAEYVLHGPWFIEEFVAYQVRLFSTPDSGHGGFPGYHMVVLLLGCFPVSVFALANLWGDRQSEDEVLDSSTLASCKRADFVMWMQILFWVVLLVFSVVRTKIVHYSSLAYFPITYLGVVTLWRAYCWRRVPLVSTIALPILGVLIGGLFVLLPVLGNNPELLREILHRDAFALALLEAPVVWDWWDTLPGLILISASLVGVFYWVRHYVWQASRVLFTGGAIFVACTLIVLVPNLEAYSQRAAIDFYKERCGEACIVRTVGFKSYAHLFYACKAPVVDSLRADDYETAARGNPGVPVYFVAKLNRLEELPGLAGCRELYRRNGFVFYRRDVLTR